MPFTLSIDGDERPFDDSHASRLPELIADVARSRADFLILTNDSTGEYVQCAEAYGRLVAERRDRGTDGWRQYRVCRHGGSRERLPPRVEGYQGYEQREVLDVNEVERIFADFVAGRSPSAGFEIMDMTDDAEPAETPVEASKTESRGLFGRLKKLLT